MLSSATQLLRLVIQGDSKGGVEALRDVGTQAGRTDSQMKKWGQSMNSAANYAAVGVVALSAVIANATRETIAYGEAVDSIADISNLGAEGSSRLVGQFQAFGVASETGAKAVKFFEKNLDDARQGGTETAEAFERLGISLGDLQTLSDEDILAMTRDGLSKTEDVTSQAAIAMKLFGKSGTEVSDWYAAAPEDMKRVNEQLERAGLVWGDKELRTWQDVIDAQREMKIAWTGLQITIAQNVLPYLPPLIEAFSRLLRVIGPLAPVLVPATAALAGFVVVVKTVMIAQTAATAVRGLYLAIGGTQALSAAATGFRVLTANIGLMTAAGGVSIGMLGALGLAVTASTAAVVGAVIAWQQWRDAVDQANQAHQEYLDNYDKARARMVEKYGEGSEQVNKYDSSLGPKKEAQYSEPWWNPFGWFANGGDFMTNGPVVFGAGEAGPERVTITPLNGSRSAGGSGMTMELHFHGPIMGGRAGVREFMKLAGEEAELAMGGLV